MAQAVWDVVRREDVKSFKRVGEFVSKSLREFEMSLKNYQLARRQGQSVAVSKLRPVVSSAETIDVNEGPSILSPDVITKLRRLERWCNGLSLKEGKHERSLLVLMKRVQSDHSTKGSKDHNQISASPEKISSSVTDMDSGLNTGFRLLDIKSTVLINPRMCDYGDLAAKQYLSQFVYRYMPEFGGCIVCVRKIKFSSNVGHITDGDSYGVISVPVTLEALLFRPLNGTYIFGQVSSLETTQMKVSVFNGAFMFHVHCLPQGVVMASGDQVLKFPAATVAKKWSCLQLEPDGSCDLKIDDPVVLHVESAKQSEGSETIFLPSRFVGKIKFLLHLSQPLVAVKPEPAVKVDTDEVQNKKRRSKSHSTSPSEHRSKKSKHHRPDDEDVKVQLP